MTVRDLLSRTSSAELTEWMAYDRLCPIDESWRADLRQGIHSALVANLNRSKGPPFIAEDFIPEFDRETVRQKKIQKQKAALRAAGTVGHERSRR